MTVPPPVPPEPPSLAAPDGTGETALAESGRSRSGSGRDVAARRGGPRDRSGSRAYWGGPFAHGVLVLAGLYVALSPWIAVVGPGFIAPDGVAGDLRGSSAGAALDAAGGTWSGLVMSNLIVGLAIAVLALVGVAVTGVAYRLGWSVAVLGAWVILAPWLTLGPEISAVSMMSNMAAGVIVLVAAVALSSTTRVLTQSTQVDDDAEPATTVRWRSEQR